MSGYFSEDDKERLEKFEGVLSELIREYNRVPEEMERLRDAGKEKSALQGIDGAETDVREHDCYV